MRNQIWGVQHERRRHKRRCRTLLQDGCSVETDADGLSRYGQARARHDLLVLGIRRRGGSCGEGALALCPVLSLNRPTRLEADGCIFGQQAGRVAVRNVEELDDVRRVDAVLDLEVDEVALALAVMNSLPVEGNTLVVVRVGERVRLENLKIRPVGEEDIFADALGREILVVGPCVARATSEADPLRIALLAIAVERKAICLPR